jgi:hypothetical protein
MIRNETAYCCRDVIRDSCCCYCFVVVKKTNFAKSLIDCFEMNSPDLMDAGWTD